MFPLGRNAAFQDWLLDHKKRVGNQNRDKKNLYKAQIKSLKLKVYRYLGLYYTVLKYSPEN